MGIDSFDLHIVKLVIIIYQTASDSLYYYTAILVNPVLAV